MNERLLALKRRVRDRSHHIYRQERPINILPECEAENLSWSRRAARLTRRQCEAERVIIEADEQLVYTRTLPATIPPLYRLKEWERLTAGRTLHELGPINNVCADWGKVLAEGLEGWRAAALAARQRTGGDPEAAEFLDCALETIDAVMALAARYACRARKLGRADVAAVLERVPRQPARTFREALQALRLLHAVVWLSRHYHVGLGRFDQYMWPYVDTLLDAKAHPSRHRNLIVRVWGWSGYFCELGPEYQDHIIARHVYG